MALHPFGITSTVFLVLYSIVFICLVAGFAAQRSSFKSRWAFLLFHVVVRLGAQSVGIALDQYGVASSTGLALLKAFITLSAEGYLTLVLCILRQLISWQRRSFGHSWVHGKSDKSYLKLSYKEASQSPEFILDLMLGAANALVIVGGLLPLAMDRDKIVEAWETDAPLIQSSKALRGVGQGIFLAITIFAVTALGHDAFTRSKRVSSKLRTEITILVAACPFIVVRGAFGLAQAVDSMINFAGPYIYSGAYGGSFETSFVIKEAVLATAMEWCTCACLLATAMAAPSKSHQADADSDADVETAVAPSVDGGKSPKG
ncbi:hypothetical protein BCV69DRAFT_296052 [Microstroma glucosiphilum]|uniref:Uncharacterized protein n=1 Tax=Pseudomicrostroma glucosiphilum TaxID=1684307 RepID=A0A316UER9_9BASI|nr:hypothetical protein BCV69DRAFT_296052 [Pseudomicrostroma glucosiphilum]PWN23736.1 hypothetical protein BCV69DRAFT_296052 [Pseudomicrostroma glucosiphilum]